MISNSEERQENGLAQDKAARKVNGCHQKVENFGSRGADDAIMFRNSRSKEPTNDVEPVLGFHSSCVYWRGSVREWRNGIKDVGEKWGQSNSGKIDRLFMRQNRTWPQRSKCVVYCEVCECP